MGTKWRGDTHTPPSLLDGYKGSTLTHQLRSGMKEPGPTAEEGPQGNIARLQEEEWPTTALVSLGLARHSLG